MAKKSTVKVRLVPEEKTDSKFFYYAKKSSTEDGKIQVMNFQTKQVKDFVTIHEQFYRRGLK